MNDWEVPKLMPERKIDDGAILRIETREGPVWCQFLRLDTSDLPDDYLLSPLHEVEEPNDLSSNTVVRFDDTVMQRSPFILHCGVFRLDFQVGDIAVVSIADLPDEDFCKWTRRPSDVVNLSTGEGPWCISGPDEYFLISWLSLNFAQMPYFLSILPSRLGSFYFRLADNAVLYEVNRRCVRYGVEREKEAGETSIIRNTIFVDPPYARATRREAVLRPGDLVEVPSIHGLAYLQVTPYKMFFGNLLRVFDGYWKQRPDKFSPDMFSTKFLICVPFIGEAIEGGSFQKVGRIDLVDDDGSPPATRDQPLFSERGWYEARVYKDQRSKNEKFDSRHASISPATVGEPPQGLVEYLDIQWRPQTDLWTQIAVQHNQLKRTRSRSGSIRRVFAKLFE